MQYTVTYDAKTTQVLLLIQTKSFIFFNEVNPKKFKVWLKRELERNVIWEKTCVILPEGFPYFYCFLHQNYFKTNKINQLALDAMFFKANAKIWKENDERAVFKPSTTVLVASSNVNDSLMSQHFL